jgi:hypothetical protein
MFNPKKSTDKETWDAPSQPKYGRRWIHWVLVSISSLILSACVPTTPQWDAQFGQSVRLAQQQQVLNPNAGGDAPANGIDAVSGREAIGRYRNSFKEPTPVNSSFTIGVSR